MAEINGGPGWGSWVKIGSAGVGVGTVLFGMVSGFLRIDARLEEHGRALQTLATAVQKITDRAASLDAVDQRIERACLQMALANPRFVCPFGPSPPPAKRLAAPKASPSAPLKP